MEKIFHANKKKEYQYLDERNIKTKAIIDKEGHYIMI